MRSEFNNAVLSVSGLSDGITYLSRREYATQRTISVPSDQDYVVRVVSLAGYSLSYTLQAARRTAAKSPTPTTRPTALPLPSTTPRPQPSVTSASTPTERALGQLSNAAQTFARSRPPIKGIAVFVPARGVVYADNADEQVPTASVVKVLVMLVTLEQARQEGRPASEDELALLWPMITESDNDSTSQLWEHIGRGQVVSSTYEASA